MLPTPAMENAPMLASKRPLDEDGPDAGSVPDRGLEKSDAHGPAPARLAKRLRVAKNTKEGESAGAALPAGEAVGVPREELPPTTWLVTGASRGLGLALVRYLSADARNVVLATCRDPASARELRALAEARAGRAGEGSEVDAEEARKDGDAGGEQKAQGGVLHVLRLDVEEEASIVEAAAEATRILGARGLGLDYLLNNAGINAGLDGAFAFSVPEFLRTMRANVAGPALVSAAFLPLLRAGSAGCPPKGGSLANPYLTPGETPGPSPDSEDGTRDGSEGVQERRKGRGVIMNMSSTLGSIGFDCGTKMCTYSMSKSALNMLTYKQSREVTDLIPISICPGWVKTEMGGPGARLETDESIPRVVALLERLQPSDAGRFFNYRGEELPW